MMQLRKSLERGHANHGWLDSYHTFSFADYHDPAHMGFRALRVINEDRIAPAQGFGTHPHRDMEILTYILEGELTHRDSMGNGRIIMQGEVQAMSAGTGVTHSEFNPSDKNPVHLLQIWILPHTKNVTPSYSEWKPTAEETRGWSLIASGGGEAGALRIHQDARLYLARSGEATALTNPVPPKRYGWLQVASGSAEMAGQPLDAGDGVAFSGGDATTIRSGSGTTLLLFDLA